MFHWAVFQECVRELLRQYLGNKHSMAMLTVNYLCHTLRFLETVSYLVKEHFEALTDIIDVYDLLNQGNEIGNTRVAVRAVLEGKHDVQVTDYGRTKALLEKGEGFKRKSSTQMNDRSSRAHTICILSLTQTNEEPNSTCEKASRKVVTKR